LFATWRERKLSQQKIVNKSGLPGNDLFAFLNLQKDSYGQLKKWIEDIVTALMAGIKLGSCVVNNLYGKSSFRKSEKDY
jgi:hypothetical protein